ncbi:MAG: WecB/TagA/CpsF family glycosyltransferase [Caulobacteraceae bacterium]
MSDVTPACRVRLLGGDLDLVTPDDVLSFTGACVRSGSKAIIANHNAHTLTLVRRDPSMGALYEMADIIQIDSMPLIAWGRALGAPLGRRNRCTYLGWRDAFWRAAQEGAWRVFYLGGAPGVAAAAAANIRARRPEVVIGVRDGFFDKSDHSSENEEVIATINAFCPDILFVGLGAPAQERWVFANYHRLQRGVVFTVGGAFDYEAGIQTPPPTWAGEWALDWLFRFISQPSRLFGRYFVEPWALVTPALADLKRVWPSARPSPSPETQPGRD